MEEARPDNRSYRLLDLYKRLQQGEALSKRELADKYRVSEKTVQRDIEGLREYLAGEQSYLEVVYDKEAGGYRISRESAEGLQPEEVFAGATVEVKACGLQPVLLPDVRNRFGGVDEVVVYGFAVVLQGFFGFFQFGLLFAVAAFKQQGDEHADEEAAEAGKDELGDEGQVVHGIFLCGRRAV